MTEYLEHIITEEEDGRSVGRLLSHAFLLSGRKIRSLKFEEDGILLDGVRTHTSARGKAGQCLAVRLADPDKKKSTLLPASLPLDILFEDEILLVINKPAGLAVHPAGGHAWDTLANALRAYFDRTDPAARVHFAGRLDKDTSGLMLCAKSGVTADRLRKSLTRDGCGKTYLALAAGSFSEEEGRIDLPLAAAVSSEDGLIRMRGDIRLGKAAETCYTVEKQYDGYALLSLQLLSGRTHQIRANLAAIGHPLLGDPLYGDPAVTAELAPALNRTALHAARLRFLHPLREELLDFSAPLPDDIAVLLPESRPGSYGSRSQT